VKNQKKRRGAVLPMEKYYWLNKKIRAGEGAGKGVFIHGPSK